MSDQQKNNQNTPKQQLSMRNWKRSSLPEESLLMYQVFPRKRQDRSEKKTMKSDAQ